MSEKVVFTPNVPVEVALKFPDGREVEGRFGNQMMYSLTDGRLMYLDMAVAAKINLLEVQRGEVFCICKRWSGKKGDNVQWDVWRPENAQLTHALVQSIQVINERKGSNGASTSAASPATAVTQSPSNNGNGTTPALPAPRPPAVSSLAAPPSKIPMNRAVTEAVRMVQAAMKETGEQWSDQSRQDLASTILIGMQREGWLTLPDRSAA